MKIHLYLSVIPEALIASMLKPEEFGLYLSTGNRRMSSGPAVFFELEPDKVLPAFGLDDIESRCEPHEYGAPRRSAYLSIYRVLERVPLTAVRTLNLTTRKGVTLTLESGQSPAVDERKFFLYQELCPVSPRVVSRLDPVAFARYMTSRENPVSLPKLFFADMRLDGLAQDPVKGSANRLPYSNMAHLRECLSSLVERPNKTTKVVNRELLMSDLYANVHSGFFLGDSDGCLAFPMPDAAEISEKHHLWSMSATSAGQL